MAATLLLLLLLLVREGMHGRAGRCEATLEGLPKLEAVQGWAGSILGKSEWKVWPSKRCFQEEFWPFKKREPQPCNL